jgi:beta-carotene 15,15'-dioxygenase
MQNFIKIAIVGSFFSLWMSSYVSENFQIILGFALIFSFGILHGANDLLLIQNISFNTKKSSFVKILTYYVVIVLLGAICFYLIPWLALLLFIIVSSYHFGEQQIQGLEILQLKWFRLIFKFTYGFIVLLLLFNFHKTEVQKIVFDIINYSISSNYITMFLKIFGFILLGFYFYLYIYVEKNRTLILLEIFYLLVFAIIFMSSSLIWGFAIYFILWHSIPSMIDQINFLYGETSIKTAFAYFKSAFLYWFASLFGITLLYFTFKEIKLFDALFFSFLAAITFPHALVILKMFEKKG